MSSRLHPIPFSFEPVEVTPNAIPADVVIALKHLQPLFGIEFFEGDVNCDFEICTSIDQIAEHPLATGRGERRDRAVCDRKCFVWYHPCPIDVGSPAEAIASLTCTQRTVKGEQRRARLLEFTTTLIARKPLPKVRPTCTRLEHHNLSVPLTKRRRHRFHQAHTIVSRLWNEPIDE